jgi:DNA-binding XRE family transcriptional regulator
MTELQLRLINLVRNGLNDARMTQSELAVAVGISDRHICRLLSGADTGSIRVWNDMLRHLKIPVTELV